METIHANLDPAKKYYDLCRERCPYIPDAKPSITATPPIINDDGTTQPPAKTPVTTADAPELDDEFADDNLGKLASSFVDGP